MLVVCEIMRSLLCNIRLIKCKDCIFCSRNILLTGVITVYVERKQKRLWSLMLMHMSHQQ